MQGQRILVKFEVPDEGERLYIGTIVTYDKAKVCSICAACHLRTVCDVHAVAGLPRLRHACLMRHVMPCKVLPQHRACMQVGECAGRWAYGAACGFHAG